MKKFIESLINVWKIEELKNSLRSEATNELKLELFDKIMSEFGGSSSGNKNKTISDMKNSYRRKVTDTNVLKGDEQNNNPKQINTETIKNLL